MNLTFESFLTPEGVVAAAAVITALVQLIKTVLPQIGERVSGALMAFVLSAILYVLTAIATSVNEMNAGLTVFLAWLSCATSAVGIFATIAHVNEVRTTSSKPT